jgi:hypothetical protein
LHDPRLVFREKKRKREDNAETRKCQRCAEGEEVARRESGWTRGEGESGLVNVNGRGTHPGVFWDKSVDFAEKKRDSVLRVAEEFVRV